MERSRYGYVGVRRGSEWVVLLCIGVCRYVYKVGRGCFVETI